MKVGSFGLIVAVALFFGIGNRAKADVLHISGTGTWDMSQSATAYSTPGSTWSFAFDLPNPISANPTTEFLNFTYLLNGIGVADTLKSIEFFDVEDGGLFTLHFTSGGFLGMFGDQLSAGFGTLNEGLLPPPYLLSPGVFEVFQINTASQDGLATGIGSLVSETPLPAAWTMMAAGLGGYGFVMRRRKQAPRTAA